jgi:hypothetical protein
VERTNRPASLLATKAVEARPRGSLVIAAVAAAPLVSSDPFKSRLAIRRHHWLRAGADESPLDVAPAWPVLAIDCKPGRTRANIFVRQFGFAEGASTGAAGLPQPDGLSALRRAIG